MLTYNINGKNVTAKGSTYLKEDKIKENHQKTSTESEYTTMRKSTTHKSTTNSPVQTTSVASERPMIELKTATTPWADSDGDFRYKFKSRDGSCTIDILDNPGDDMVKGAIDRYTGDQMGSCADFEDDITSVLITFMRGDGWMGEYLKMYQDDKVFICPLGKWVEIESPKVEFPCY